jgi:CarD family transcriptional regulator
MTFEVGDAVVHPAHGAGIITGYKKFKRQGEDQRYYTIKLLGKAKTSLMIPVKSADEVGVRSALSKSELERLWQIMGNKPQSLPDDYKKRHRLVNKKLRAGDALQIAEVIRDMGWRQQELEDLTKKGQRLYQEGIEKLAGEVAAARGIDLLTAEKQVRKRLRSALEE